MLWPCPQILRPDWKGFPKANPLAYWASSTGTKEKVFHNVDTWMESIFKSLGCFRPISDSSGRSISLPILSDDFFWGERYKTFYARNLRVFVAS